MYSRDGAYIVAAAHVHLRYAMSLRYVWPQKTTKGNVGEAD